MPNREALTRNECQSLSTYCRVLSRYRICGSIATEQRGWFRPSSSFSQVLTWKKKGKKLVVWWRHYRCRPRYAESSRLLHVASKRWERWHRWFQSVSAKVGRRNVMERIGYVRLLGNDIGLPKGVCENPLNRRKRGVGCECDKLSWSLAICFCLVLFFSPPMLASPTLPFGATHENLWIIFLCLSRHFWYTSKLNAARFEYEVASVPCSNTQVLAQFRLCPIQKAEEQHMAHVPKIKKKKEITLEQYDN